MIQIDASSFAEFEISEFEISRFDCIFYQANGAGNHELYSPQQSMLSPRQGQSQGKKTKADHVESKMGESSGAPQKAGPSHAQKGKGPALGAAPMGSAVSLQSNISRASRGKIVFMYVA